MNRKRFFLLASILIFSALFFAARNAASWRPQTLGKVGQNARHALILSPAGRFAIAGYTQIWDFSQTPPRLLRNLSDNDAFYGFADENSYWSAQTFWRTPNNLFGQAKISRRDLATGATNWMMWLKVSSENQVRFLEFSEDKKSLLITRQKSAEIWDIFTKHKLKSWNWPAYLDALAGIQNDKIFVTVGEEIILYDLKKQRVIWQKRIKNRAFAGDFNLAAEGKTLWVLNGKPNRAQFFDAASGKLLWKRLLPWMDTIAPLQFSPEGQRIYATHWAGVEILDARNGKKIASRKLPNSAKTFVFALSPDENWLYTLEKNGDLKRWRVK